MADQLYARCLEEGCGLEFADPEAAREHSKATMAPATDRGPGVIAAGHRYQVLNMPPEEQQVRRVREAIERALEGLYEELDYQGVQEGRFTAKELREQMEFYDLGIGWDEWVREGG